MKFSVGSNHKAVRDRIPEIVGSSDKNYVFKELSDTEFLAELENKLQEELAEYFESKEIEELADLMEVIHRIADLKGFSKEAFESLRLKKKQERGGFEKNLVMLDIHDENHLNQEDIDTSDESSPVVFRPENSVVIEKHGVSMRIYTTKKDSPNAAVLYQETEIGHMEEFVHERSDFLYYILEGNGTWIVEDKEYEVRAGNVVVVPAGKRFWFKGNLKQICITSPAWEEQYERHIRDIQL
ncbi:MAG: cupin domain-containing protein [Methanomethylovorans sp.]|uniref:cupin domain-containing protein n=1 Tax=Methanomethylovorans sp. TaxID=2758717 RepID=UPI0035306195